MDFKAKEALNSSLVRSNPIMTNFKKRQKYFEIRSANFFPIFDSIRIKFESFTVKFTVNSNFDSMQKKLLKKRQKS